MPELVRLDIQFLALGTGYPEYENMLRYWENAAHDKVRGIITYSNELASKIYSGCDMFLMPSKSEPCGLAQMIAMRYGAIPIVHAVGGLRETVWPYNPDTKAGDGVTFQSYNPWDMFDAVKRAISLYQNKENWKHIRKNAMARDFSWEASAKEYSEVYKSIHNTHWV
jgi:starch synthase